MINVEGMVGNHSWVTIPVTADQGGSLKEGKCMWVEVLWGTGYWYDVTPQNVNPQKGERGDSAVEDLADTNMTRQSRKTQWVDIMPPDVMCWEECSVISIGFLLSKRDTSLPVQGAWHRWGSPTEAKEDRGMKLHAVHIPGWARKWNGILSEQLGQFEWRLQTRCYCVVHVGSQTWGAGGWWCFEQTDPGVCRVDGVSWGFMSVPCSQMV